MNLKNEKSKLYTVILPFTAIIAVISAIIFLMTNPNDTRLLDLQQLFSGILMLLLGTKYMFARKNKFGYFLYVTSALSFIVFISRNIY